MDTVPELQDARRVWHFWIDDQLIDTYGQQIGPYGIAIYAYLARRAKLGSAFPSHGRIAQDIHCSRDTVIRTLKKLQTVALISIEPRYTESGDPDTNLYTLLDLSHLHGQGSSSQQQGSSSQQQGSSCEQGRVVAVSREGSSCELHKVFSLKDTQEKEKENPPTPFQGDAPTEENGAVPAKGKRQRKIQTLRTDYSPGFLAWWGAYPPDRRFDKPICYKRWCELGLESRWQEQVEKIERLKLTTWKDCERKHVKTSLPYLNGGRWDDDLVPLDSASMGRLSDNERRTAEATRRILEEDDHESAGQKPVLRLPQ